MNEANLHSLLESVPGGILVVDEVGLIRHSNAEAEKLFGYSKGELLSQAVECLVPVRFRSSHPAKRAMFLKNPSKRQMGAGVELSGLRKDGSEFPVEIGLSQIDLGAGLFAIASIVDISERMASEKRYKLFVDGVKEYAIVMLDIDGKVVSWGEGAERLFGFKACEILGKSFLSFFTAEDLQIGKPAQELQMAEHEGKCEVRGWRVKKGGERFLASVVVNALRDMRGALQGYGKVIRDLSERVKQEEKFQLIVEAAPNGIILVDDHGKISLCNSDIEKMFGYSREELLGKSVEILIPKRLAENHSSLRDAYQRAPVKRQMGVARDLAGLRKDRKEFPVEIGLNPLQTGDGNFVLASIVDITSRKEVQEKLQTAFAEIQQKNQEMEQFVYTVSHDLKAPLVTSAAFIGFLKEDLSQKNFEGVHDSLDRLDKAHRRMQQLINDLLELSRVGRLELQWEWVDTSTLIKGVLENYAETLKSNGVNVEISKNIAKLWGDKNRALQVFENFLSNAIKYGLKGVQPQIHIFSIESDTETCFCVKDNGPGIAPQYHHKIFGLFQRLQTDKEGTGVGLAIVLRIMQTHGGRAWVVSDVGKGAEFWIAFPKPNLPERKGL